MSKRRKRNPVAKALENDLFKPRVIKPRIRKTLDDLAAKEAEDEIDYYTNGGNDD